MDQFYVVMRSDTHRVQLSVRSRVGGGEGGGGTWGVSPALKDHVQICPDSCRGKWEESSSLPPPTTTTTHHQSTPPKPSHPIVIVMSSVAGPDQEVRDFFFFTLDHMIARLLSAVL